LHADLCAIHIEALGYQGVMKGLTSFISHRLRTGHTHSRSEHLQLLSDLSRFAEDLGAEVIQVSGNDIARTLVNEARARHITQLVLGLPVRSRLEELLSGSVINRVLRLNKEMRIHLVPYRNA
jgi:two-component system sensor histidine kinase KdpD